MLWLPLTVLFHSSLVLLYLKKQQRLLFSFRCLKESPFCVTRAE